MKNNKLIAEFMGTSIGYGNDYYTNDKFPYNTSWDWLMPVIEKVFILSEDEEAWRMDIESGLTTLNIDETCRAVVEFIKNQND